MGKFIFLIHMPFSLDFVLNEIEESDKKHHQLTQFGVHMLGLSDFLQLIFYERCQET